MTDPAWYIEALADHPEWAAHVAECAALIPLPDAHPGDGAYMMQTVLAAFALHMHRLGGGVVRMDDELLDGALLVVGTPGDEAPRTLEEARARIVMLRHEVARLREQIAALTAREVSGE